MYALLQPQNVLDSSTTRRDSHIWYVCCTTCSHAKHVDLYAPIKKGGLDYL